LIDATRGACGVQTAGDRGVAGLVDTTLELERAARHRFALVHAHLLDEHHRQVVERDSPLDGHQDVRGPEVAVDDQALVGLVNRLADAGKEAEPFVEAQLGLLAVAVEGQSVDELHDQARGEFATQLDAERAASRRSTATHVRSARLRPRTRSASKSPSRCGSGTRRTGRRRMSCPQRNRPPARGTTTSNSTMP
jgi:hypothetical protein